MFKKKPQIKPLSPLRSSDRRKIADQIISDLGLQHAALPDTATEEEKTAATAQHTTLRNALLPDNALSARFTTTHGPDLKQISGTVYVGTYNGDQRILWFKIQEKMYPTVYTLWSNPAILPLLHTHPFVMTKLQGGADLMTPGLAGGPPFPQQAKKGSVVAVASTERPSVPLMVGTCEIDVSELRQVQGAKGHAVETVHWAGDELWGWSPGAKEGVNAPAEVPGWLIEKNGGTEDGRLANATSTLVLNDQEEEEGEEDQGGVSLSDISPPSNENPAQPNTSKPAEDPTPSTSTSIPSRTFTTPEIDSIFRSAFLYGIHTQIKTNPTAPNHALDFPLNQSYVMSHLVQPFLPAFTAEEANQLQIKKTSYKNIKKFIRSLDKAQIIKCKERDGNEVVIFDIDFKDRAIAEFQPYRLPKKETKAATNGTASSDDASTSGASTSSGPLKITILYKPTSKLQPLFDASKESDPHGYYTSTTLTPLITTYIEQENLYQSPTNKRQIKLDPFLANTVFNDPKTDREVIARGLVTRESLLQRILSHCSVYHTISSGSTSSTSKPKAGPPPKINITLETRSGNKTVTKVSGLEAFGIAPQPLADELRKSCAGSTSVEKLVGSSTKAPVMEVMVQGPQKDAIIRALEKRGVDGKRGVEVVDKVKKKK